METQYGVGDEIAGRNEFVGVESSSCDQSTADLSDTLACHLSYTHLQSADERNEMNSTRWQNNYIEEYQHLGMNGWRF